jgi:hypothetical protein
MKIPSKRWCLVSDDDGHSYVIPAESRDEFEKWVEATSNDEEFEGEDFEKYSLGGNPECVTFTDPKWGLDGISLCQH